LYLRPAIEQELPGIQIWICCPDRLSYLVEKEDRIILASALDANKKEFAHIRQLRGDHVNHPIWNLLEESQLVLPDLRPPQINRDRKICAIWPSGNSPTKSLNGQQIESLMRLARDKGYSTTIEGNPDECGWIIGVENETLFRAGVKGIRTSLVPTGVGARLYQKMFPCGEVLKLIF
jgi:hypothetical protein